RSCRARSSSWSRAPATCCRGSGRASSRAPCARGRAAPARDGLARPRSAGALAPRPRQAETRWARRCRWGRTAVAMKVADRIFVLTDLVMGAGWADDEFAEDEQRAVRRVIADLVAVEPDALPAPVEKRIRDFDPLKSDLEAAARDFADDPPMAKRRLLELVGRMVDADGVVDMQEDEYLRRLAGHLGMEYSEYSDLVLDYEIE